MLTYEQGVTRPKGCRMSIVEAVWKPDQVKSSKSVVTEGEANETPQQADMEATSS